MLIWHVHRKSCLAIDYDWFYRSNINRPYISPQEYIVSWLSLGHSFLPKAPWKEKYYQQQQSRWENINVSMSPGTHQAAFSGVTLIMRLRLPTVGWVRFSKAPKTYHPRRIGQFVIFRSWIQNFWMKMTFIWFFYRYFFVVDRSAVTGRFSLFLWVRDGVVQLPSWRASSRPEIALECKILSFSRTSRARMRFWKT